MNNYVTIDNQKILIKEIDEQSIFKVRAIYDDKNIESIKPDFGQMSLSIKRNLCDDSFNMISQRQLLPRETIKSLGGNDKAFGLFTSVNVDNKFYSSSFTYNHDNNLTTETMHRSLFDSHPLSAKNSYPISISWMFDKDGEENDKDEMVSSLVVSPQFFPIQDSFQITNEEGVLFKMVKSFNVRFKDSEHNATNETTDESLNSPFDVSKTYSYVLVKLNKPKQGEYTKKVADIYIFNDENSDTSQDYQISKIKYRSSTFTRSDDNAHYEPQSERKSIVLEDGTSQRATFVGSVLIDQVPSNLFINKSTINASDQTVGEIVPYDLKNTSFMSEVYMDLNAVLKNMHFQNFTNISKAFLDPMNGIIKLSVSQNNFNETNKFAMKNLTLEEIKYIKSMLQNKRDVSLSSLESRSLIE